MTGCKIRMSVRFSNKAVGSKNLLPLFCAYIHGTLSYLLCVISIIAIRQKVHPSVHDAFSKLAFLQELHSTTNMGNGLYGRH